MYLGQERWAHDGAAAQTGAGPVKAIAQTTPQKPSVLQSGEVGDAATLAIAGCVDPVVGPTIRGSYSLSGLNHGRPVFKRGQKASGFDVLIFYWDERDGAANCGWWFAPSIGSEQVWAYQPGRTATPPVSGWRVPISGPVDQTMTLRAAGPAQQLGQQSLQEAQRKRAEEIQEARKAQQKKLEEMKEAQRKSVEEQQKKLFEEQTRIQEQRRATAVVQQAMKRCGSAPEDKIEELLKELEAALEKELENCGAQKDNLRSQADECIKNVRERARQAAELKKKAEEARREAERRQKEANDESDRLLAELAQLTDLAEVACKNLEDTAGPLHGGEHDDVDDEQEVSALADSIDKAGCEAKDKLKACSEFIVVKGPMIKRGLATGGAAAVPIANGESAKAPAAATLLGISRRVAECTHQVEAMLRRSKEDRVKLVRRVGAKRKIAAAHAIFRKYDLDRDGVWSRREVSQYARVEFGFSLPPERLNHVFSVVVGEGAKGVSCADFQRLKVMVGVAREMARDEARRSIREEREKELLEARAKHEASVAEATAAMQAADTAVKELESQTKALAGKIAAMTPAETSAEANRVADVANGARDAASKVQDTAQTLRSGAEDREELRVWLDTQARKLATWTSGFDRRLAAASEALSKLRSHARDIDARQLEASRVEVLDAFRSHLWAKCVSPRAVFEELDSDHSGRIGVSDFANLVPKFEKANGEPALDSSKMDLQRIFSSLDEDDKGFLTKEDFDRMAMLYMTVVKDVAFTDKLALKESSTVRVVNSGEVVKVLEGPVREEESGVVRVRAKAQKDDVQGWITVRGNKGTTFLEMGGALYKVVRETILTDDFKLDGATRALKDTTRKLKVGDVAEVREWPRKEEASGLVRMKCRLRVVGGPVGWATTVGNSGMTFMEAM
mmetsp:Transcript_78760/g.218910  ORF Transcript_78760/g.218910 Transcript_78760/m.218910 type:complete len:908 (+) Transcript_78760:117-2840(+)